MFVAEPQRESLLGDLDERFARDRSTLGYWKQAIAGAWHLRQRRTQRRSSR